jgi:ribosomal protein S18 acetylase RimI-like enzyme
MIKSLGKTDFDTLFTAFNAAFRDYEMQVNKHELSVMLQRRGFDAELSFGAFEDEKLVSFTLNGSGLFNGIKTAYDTGTGTLEEFRGRGLATQIFDFSLPFLKQTGIRQYLLEVLQHNTKAINVYKKLGFKVSREFSYFVQDADKVLVSAHLLPSKYVIREIDLSRKQEMVLFWDFIPSWQNSFEAILRRPDDFVMRGVFDDTKLAGYGILDPNSGDITQIAVSNDYRRQGIGSGIFNELLKCNRFKTVKAVNVEISCTSMKQFLVSKNIPEKGKQFEMIREL